MARILYYTTHGTDDPTRAGLAFVGANGAKDAGHDPVLALLADGTYLLKGNVAASVVPVAFPPVSELMATAIKNGTPIHV
jgi:predicted peroxiredoxin